MPPRVEETLQECKVFKMQESDIRRLQAERMQRQAVLVALEAILTQKARQRFLPQMRTNFVDDF